MQAAETRAAIAALGTELGPAMMQAVLALYNEEQRGLAQAFPPIATDLAYGPHARHRLDLYAPATGEAPRPILVWVHGGGFLRGDKGGEGRWADAHAGSFAASAGLLGVVLNYRLAPEHGWPAGAEDLAAAIDWLKQHAPQWGGDPERIVLAGTSAGAAHVAGYLKLRPDHAGQICGAVLLSGLYGITPADDPRDRSYYGEDESLHAGRMPLAATVETGLPLLVACAEFDPPRFQAEFVGLLQRRLARHGTLPRSHVASGHNHFSIAYHLGTADRRLADEILSFLAEACA